MNLKTAARRMGVHYQTAYRWVRSGDLVAVKIGAGYEISEASLARFQAQRDAMERVPAAVDRDPAGEVEPAGDVLDQLAEMVEYTTVDAGAMYQRAAHALASEPGDGVIISLRQPDGSLRLAAFDHHDPERAVIIGAMLRFGAMDAMYARRAVDTGEVVLVPQVPQREVRNQVRPEFHQSLAHAGFYSAISAPIVGSGVVRGTVLVSRDSPGRPYTFDDRDFVSAVAARIGAAMAQAERGRVAWSLRARLGSELATWIDDGNLARVIEWVDEVPDDEAVAIVSLDATIDAATPTFAELFGTTVPECKERSVGELVDPAHAVDETFGRLRDGELDYCTVVTQPVAGEHARVVLDGAIVRQRDATPCCVLYVAHPIPEITESAVPEPPVSD